MTPKRIIFCPLPTVLFQMLVDRSGGHVEGLCDLLNGVPARVVHRTRLRGFRHRHLGTAAPDPPVNSRSYQTVLGAFDDEVVLQLCDGGEHVEEQATAGDSGVDSLGECFQSDAAGFEVLGDVLEVSHGAAKPVEFDYCEGVTVTEIVQRVVEGGAFSEDSGGVSDEDFVAAGRGERVCLGVGVLVAGGDAGVADERHEAQCRMNVPDGT